MKTMQTFALMLTFVMATTSTLSANQHSDQQIKTLSKEQLIAHANNLQAENQILKA
ncbi:hypothetical protein JD969_16640 [Planctomycetota bacterium]|nr:hypothetical protein JD969_16640 [Planctomycetota bacterium]